MKKKHAPESDEKRFAIMVDATILLQIRWFFLSNLVQPLKILINTGIWDECCGHVSPFTMNGTEYNSFIESGMGDLYPTMRNSFP